MIRSDSIRFDSIGFDSRLGDDADARGEVPAPLVLPGLGHLRLPGGGRGEHGADLAHILSLPHEARRDEVHAALETNRERNVQSGIQSNAEGWVRLVGEGAWVEVEK